MTLVPLVTLVTPSFNQGEYLERTIKSVLEQNYPRIEYMVIDGGSTDGSLQIIKEYASELAYWESTPDRGQAHAINKGLARAQGDILGWLNADDILLPGTIHRVVETFNSHPEVDVVYGRLVRIDRDGRVIPTPELPKDRVVYDKSMVIRECIVNQPGSFWKRSIMDKAGLLNEELQYVMDYEYWIRLALAGAVFHRMAEPVAAFRISDKSKTVSQSANMALEQLQVLENVLCIDSLPSLTGLTKSQLQRIARRTKATIGLHAFWGFLKMRDIRLAFQWLFYALREDWKVLFEKRWLGLGIAGIQRRLGIKGGDIAISG